MSVQVFCIKCDRSCRVPEEHVGRRVRCPGCQEIFKAEQPPLADSSADDAIQVFCTKCDQAGRVPAELLGRRVRCGGCQDTFKAEDVPVAALDEETSRTEGSRSATDATLQRDVPPPPPLPRSPQAARPKPLVEQLPPDRTYDEKKKPRSPADDEDADDDSRSSDQDRRAAEDSDRRRAPASRDDRDRRDDRDDDYEEPRAKRRPGKDDEKPRSKKDAPLLEIGRVDNPFVDSSTLLTSTEVDQSVFEFDWGDEPDSERPEKKKKPVEARDKRTESRDRDDRGSRDKRTEDRPSSRSKKETPDTDYAWDDKKAPPDELPAESSVAKGKKKAPPAVEDSSPFAFDPGADDHLPRSADSKGRLSGDRKDDSRRERGKEERPRDERKKDPPKKPVQRIEDDAASFLGLADLEPPPADEKAADKKTDDRAYFHLRQTGFWDEPRLFRVFVGTDEIIFVEAATGKEIPDMEEALRSESLDDFDKRIRRRVLDLNELPIDELLESIESSFVWSTGKIIDASIDPPAAKPAVGSRRSAVLQLVHKSKGTVAFDLPTDSDVESALSILRDPFEDILQVHVRWDKASKRFVKQ